KAIVAAPLEVRLFAPHAIVPALVNVRVPIHVRDPVNVVEMAGLTARLFTVCEMLIVPPDAFTTMVEAPTVNVPRCVSIDVTVIVDPLAARDPPALTFNVTALIAGLKPPVFSVVVPAPPAIVSVPPTSRLFAAIVYVTVDAPELNVIFPPNSWVRLAEAIVRSRRVERATHGHEARGGDCRGGGYRTADGESPESIRRVQDLDGRARPAHRHGARRPRERGTGARGVPIPGHSPRAGGGD